MVDELKTLIIEQIKNVFGNVKVYDEPVKQGLITPAFLVFIFANHQERLLSSKVSKTRSITISYFPDGQDIRTECDAVLELFQNEFHYIGNRYHVHEIEGEIVDNVLVITFDVKGLYRETIEETQMQVLGGVQIVESIRENG